MSRRKDISLKTRMSSGARYSARGLAVCLSFVLAACSAPSVKLGKADASVDSTRSNAAERASLHLTRLGEILLDLERRRTRLGPDSDTGSLDDARFSTEADRQFYQGVVRSTMSKLSHVEEFFDSSTGLVYGRPLFDTPLLLASVCWHVEGNAFSVERSVEPLTVAYELKATKVEGKGLSSVLRNVVLVFAGYESNAACAEKLAKIDGGTNRFEVDQRQNIGLIIPSAISGAPPGYV